MFSRAATQEQSLLVLCPVTTRFCPSLGVWFPPSRDLTVLTACGSPFPPFMVHRHPSYMALLSRHACSSRSSSRPKVSRSFLPACFLTGRTSTVRARALCVSCLRFPHLTGVPLRISGSRLPSGKRTPYYTSTVNLFRDSTDHRLPCIAACLLTLMAEIQ